MDIPNIDLPTPQKMTRRQKWWIAAVLTIIFGCMAFLLLKDNTLEDDSDLAMLELDKVPDEENGIRFFDELVKRYDELDDDYIRFEEMAYNRRDAEWDSVFVAEQVKRFSYLLDALKQASEAEVIRANEREPSWNEDVRLRLIPSSNNINHASLRLALENNSFEKAAEHSAISFQTACALINQGGGNGEFGCGIVILNNLHNTVANIILDENCDWSGTISSHFEKVSKVQISFDGGTEKWLRGSYQTAKKYIASYHTTKWGSNTAFYNFKPNQTVNLLAHKTRMALAQVGQTYSSSLPITYDLHYHIGINEIGHSILADIIHQLDPKYLISYFARHDIIRTMIELRSFHANTNTLPDTLDALIPEYLDKVPIDRFDGKPLRYDKNQAKVWCVGKDLTDDNGLETNETSFSRMPDPMMQFKWLVKPQ
jgi:hypothetical protein